MKRRMIRRSEPTAQNHFPLSLAIGFLSLALLWCQVGTLTPGLSRPLGGILWLITVYLSAYKNRLIWTIISAMLLFNPFGAIHRLEGLWLLGLLPWAGGAWGRRWMGAAFVAALGGWIWMNAPSLWQGLDEFIASFALNFSHINLSSSAAGLPIFFIALCFPIAAILSERRILVPLSVSISLLISLFIFWWLLRQPQFASHHIAGDAFGHQWILLLFISLIFTFWGWFDPPKVEIAKKRGYALLLGFSLIGALLVGWPKAVGTPQMEKKIAFYNKGYLDWKLPEYGTYGRGSSGLFGLLLDFLRWHGFNVTYIDSINHELITDAGVLVFINSQDSLSGAEEEIITDFVVKGGSLFVLGDHTGLGGIRESSNRLLKTYGIELNFDSAVPKRTGWAGSLSTPIHPLTAGIGLQRQGENRPGITQIGIGASLQVNGPAAPIIVGRNGWSDAGNPMNVNDGYLGDFRHSSKERLGNMVLAAEAHHGKGKVLAFGDTSPLQNGALPRSGDFVLRIFRYLLSPADSISNRWKALGGLFLLGALIIWMLTNASSAALTAGSLALFVAAGFCQQKTTGQLEKSRLHYSKEAPPLALIDHSHLPRVPLSLTTPTSSWGLHNCLLRSGFLPKIGEKWDEGALNDAEILIEIAPAKPFNREERENIFGFMEKGGLAIFCCGFEEFDGAKKLLNDYGVDIVYVPLGSVEADAQISPLDDSLNGHKHLPQNITVKFHEAWEIQLTNPTASVVLSAQDRPVIVHVPIGKGGLLVISDTEFFANHNLESPSGIVNEMNIWYLRDLLCRFAEGK